MAGAELVFANVVDRRLWESEGEGSVPLAYTIALPGRALPLVVTRYWKAPQGYVSESFEFVAPSGRVAYRSKPTVRRMTGQMDLARIDEVVEDAIFEELGIYAASFQIDGSTEGQIEFQLLLQAPTGLPKEFEDEIKKVDALWIGEETNGRDHAVPVWFVYDNGRIYVLHSDARDSGEQQVPGLPDASELVVLTRSKYRETRANRFRAAVRVIEPTSPEFDPLAAKLADRRRDRHGPPQEAINKWKTSCVIAELTPSVA
ncbi:MAG: hypothetical protein ACRDH9_07180 [Actinomycetota bacterium]